MLNLSSRPNFRTLLDACVFSGDENDQTAIIYLETGEDAKFITKKDFRRFVTNYAAAMRSLEIQKEDLVIIAHTQNLESIFLFWASLLVGAIPSMFPTITEKLDPEIYMANMAELVKNSRAQVVLTTDDFQQLLAGRIDCAVFSSSTLIDQLEKIDLPAFKPHEPAPEKVAFLQHSSGTTGLQKGVALSHEAVLNQVASYSESIMLNEDDVIVSWLPLYHDMGLIAGFLLPLIQGVPLVIMSPFDWVRHPALLLKAIDEYSGTLCWLPNFAYNHCARRIRTADSENTSLESMRMFINCSEPVRHDSHELFLERFSGQGVTKSILSVSYAMAENTFGVTQTRPGVPANLDIINRFELEHNRTAVPVAEDDPEAIVKVSCGKPIVGTTLIVVDEEGFELPERRVGEIAIKSDCMLSGYYARPDLQPFKNGWFLTGDRGYVADREIYIIGRSKDLIINAGKNVYPQDIEAIVNQIPGIHAGRAVVFGVPDEREGTELIAVVAETNLEDKEERKIISKKIRQEVGQKSMVTVSFVQLVGEKWLIKTSSGKIARAANREKWLAEKNKSC